MHTFIINIDVRRLPLVLAHPNLEVEQKEDRLEHIDPSKLRTFSSASSLCVDTYLP